LLSSVSAQPRYLVFGAKSQRWIAIEARALRVEPLTFPAPFKPEGVALSRDGKVIIFTAFHPPANNVLLFRWDRSSSEPPVSIGDDRGYHSDPTISDDGQWVYFAHNPFAFGPPGQHQDRAFAQLYRVQLNGTGLEPLTDENGCHLGPTNASAEQVFYLHTNCRGNRTLRIFDLKKSISVDLQKYGFDFSEPCTSPDQKAMLVSFGVGDSGAIAEIDLRSLQMRTLVRVGQAAPPLRPQYGTKRRDIFYQARGTVWLAGGKSTQRIAEFLGAP
jgi:hypothetical protein